MSLCPDSQSLSSPIHHPPHFTHTLHSCCIKLPSLLGCLSFSSRYLSQCLAIWHFYSINSFTFLCDSFLSPDLGGWDSPLSLLLSLLIILGPSWILDSFHGHFLPKGHGSPDWGLSFRQGSAFLPVTWVMLTTQMWPDWRIVQIFLLLLWSAGFSRAHSMLALGVAGVGQVTLLAQIEIGVNWTF